MLFGGFGFILFLISKGSGKNYCERNRNHVLCNSETSETDGDNANCQKDLKRFLLSKEDEASILRSLNFYREKVAKGKIPKGSGYSLASPSANMMRAKWDEELALMANKISNLCKPYQHCEGCLDLVRFPSMFVQSYSIVRDDAPTPYDWRAYIEQIVLNRANSSIRPITSRAHDLITWAEIYLVGCGLSIFSFEGKTIHNFVCAFGPVVPDDQDEPSVLGLPCSYCPLGSRCLSDLDVLCDCETLCFPFKYVTLRRLRRQESGSGVADNGSEEASGDEGNTDSPDDSGGSETKAPEGTDGGETKPDGTMAPEGTSPGGGVGPGGGDVTDGDTGDGPSPETGDKTDEPQPQPGITPTKATAAHPISIGFVIQLLYAICVSKILK